MLRAGMVRSKTTLAGSIMRYLVVLREERECQLGDDGR